MFLPAHISSVARRVADADRARASGHRVEEEGEYRQDVECSVAHFQSRTECKSKTGPLKEIWCVCTHLLSANREFVTDKVADCGVGVGLLANPWAASAFCHCGISPNTVPTSSAVSPPSCRCSYPRFTAQRETDVPLTLSLPPPFISIVYPPLYRPSASGVVDPRTHLSLSRTLLSLTKDLTPLTPLPCPFPCLPLTLILFISR